MCNEKLKMNLFKVRGKNAKKRKWLGPVGGQSDLGTKYLMENIFWIFLISHMVCNDMSSDF